ncbi:radical SAM protein [bacterium]|nr:radical SAM protein [bacterium]
MELKDFMMMADKRVDELHELINLGMIYKKSNFLPGGIHYPYWTTYPKIEYEDIFKDYKLPENGEFDAYVHVPFCSTKCVFCHFPAMYKAPDEAKERFIDAVNKEMNITMNRLGLNKIKLRTALIAGGTSTDLTPNQLKKFLTNFTSKCDMSNTRQFNFDVSPHNLVGSTGIERLKILKDFGVTRLSIGVQSLHDDILRLMNRAHDKSVAISGIKNAQDMGFKVNIEFIYGYPTQTFESWFEDLKQMIALDADEIMLYRLKIDAHGDWQGNIKGYRTLHPDEFLTREDTLRMKQIAIDFLRENGYSENVNMRRVFTKKVKDYSLYAFHQCCNMKDQLAFGPSAYLSLNDRFLLNTSDFEKYYDCIEKGIMPVNRGLIRDSETQQRWAIIMPLKNRYVDKRFFKTQTGVDIETTTAYPIIKKLIEYGLAQESERDIRLTPKGAFFADEVVGLLYQTNHNPFPKDDFNEGPLNPYSLNMQKVC